MSDPSPSLALVPDDPAGKPRSALLAYAPDTGRLVVTPSPDPRTAEGYMRITARILLESDRTEPPTIGVVSAAADEGRTVATVNLAACLARARSQVGRVLLVDGDVRSRLLTRMFCSEGPSDVAAAAPRHPITVATALDGVDLLTAPLLGDPLSVLSPEDWRASFDRARGDHPYVIVDCPALDEDPRGAVLCASVDRVVVVARVGHTPRTVLERLLRSVGERALGVVLHGPGEE